MSYADVTEFLIRHYVRQFSSVMRAVFEIPAPLGHCFRERRHLTTDRILGVAIFAGLPEIIATSVGIGLGEISCAKQRYECRNKGRKK
jgi:hypothetical protein